MLRVERHRLILKLLEADATVSIADFLCQLEVTPMTLWRDLRHLEEMKQLVRIRGGAMRADAEKEPRFESKLDSAAGAKRRIAEYAATNLIKDGDIISLEGGTTVAALAERLKHQRLKVLTNSLPVLNRVAKSECRPTIYTCGGLYREESGTFVGAEATTFYSRRKTTTFFMSATGIDELAGITDPNPQEIEVKQSMLNQAGRVVLLADRSKIKQVSFMEIAPMRRIHVLVTERDTPVDSLEWVHKHGTRLVKV